MLGFIVQRSLRHRSIVIALAITLLIYGGIVASHAPLDVFPEFVAPQVTIQTEAPGLSAEQVEMLVTRPVESTINGAPDLASVRSESIQGLSVVTATFKENANIHLARQSLAEKLGSLGRQLPDAARPPTLSPLTSSTMDLLKIGLVSKSLSAKELRSFVDWTLKPRLLAVPGVAHINVFGGEVEELQITVQPAKLAAFHLALTDVLEAARTASAIRGAGFIDTPNQRVVIQTNGQLFSPEELGEVVVRNGSPIIRLRDLATIQLAPEPAFGAALIMGDPGVLVTMVSQYGANTLAVTHSLEDALTDLQPVFSAKHIQIFNRLHRPASFIETALANVNHSLLIGAALVSLVLVLFLLDLRLAFISFISIPLSLLSAVLVLDSFGVSLNTMTLGGFAVAIGVVVDDAIIDVENILRRLRENLLLPSPQPLWRVVLQASTEVRTAVVYATLIVAVVLLPVVTMSGLQGRFFAPLGIAFILSILASLVVALTVTPALALVFLRNTKSHPEPRWIATLKSLHRSLLHPFLLWPKLSLTVAIALLFASLSLLPHFHGALLPEFREGHFVVGIKSLPGQSIEESLRIGKLLSAKMLAHPRIATVEEQIGRAEQGEDTFGPERSEFHIELKPHTTPTQETETQSFLRSLLKEFPGVTSEVMTFLGDRIGETISGETASVVVNIYGENLDQLDSTARLVAKQLAATPGNADLQVKSPPGAPILAVHLRPDRLTQFGFRPVEVLNTIEIAFQGSSVAQIVRENQTRNLTVILDKTARQDPESVGDLLLTNADGLHLPLRELADLQLTNGRPNIQHDGARRRQTVTCNVEGRPVASFVKEARQRIEKKISLPQGLYLEWSGAAEEEQKSTRELLLHFSLAFAGIVALLCLVFRRFNHVALVLANLPFALVGGILAVFLSGGSTSIGSWVGFVTLFGISTRNSIMLISHYDHLITQEGLQWSLKTATQGASERLVPILMTALVTALGVLPLALGSGEAGREIEGPMAIVILGGLLSSTALNLLLLPALAWKWGRFSPTEIIDSP
ncbi:MAG: efflux RND transporter permease subunit [Verrucomicrobiota bacterium]